MNRIRLLFVLGFVLSMGAGVVVGLGVGRAPKRHAEPGPSTRPSLESDLGLDPQQAEQVHAIWSSVWSSVRQLDVNRGERSRTLRQERDDAIKQLIPADRSADYERIVQEYKVKVADLTKDRDKLFQDAEQKMKPLLTEAQWKRFEEIKKERERRRESRDGRDGHDGRDGRPPNGHGPPH
jgi:hypothetical protein